jgi:hypothetical protein
VKDDNPMVYGDYTAKIAPAPVNGNPDEEWSDEAQAVSI